MLFNRYAHSAGPFCGTEVWRVCQIRVSESWWCYGSTLFARNKWLQWHVIAMTCDLSLPSLRSYATLQNCKDCNDKPLQDCKDCNDLWIAMIRGLGAQFWGLRSLRGWVLEALAPLRWSSGQHWGHLVCSWGNSIRETLNQAKHRRAGLVGHWESLLEKCSKQVIWKCWFEQWFLKSF